MSSSYGWAVFSVVWLAVCFGIGFLLGKYGD